VRKIFPLLFLLILPFVHATPIWFKPSTYISYRTFEPSGGNFVTYQCNGTYFFITGISEVRVNFTVVGISSGYARINAEVVLFPQRKNSSSTLSGLKITFLSGSDKLCRFWKGGYKFESRVYRDGKKINLTEVIVNEPLTFHGTYSISLDNGTVYDESGRYFGHTVLWGLRELKPGDVFAIINGSAVTVVRNDETDYDIITYWRTFQRPNGNLITNWSHITLPFYQSSFADIYYYNPALDITEVMMGSAPDLRAIGIVSISPNDVEAERYNMLHKEELLKGKLKTIRPQGLSLYDANINIGNLHIAGKPPRTPLVYLFLASLFLPLVAYKRR